MGKKEKDKRWLLINGAIILALLLSYAFFDISSLKRQITYLEDEISALRSRIHSIYEDVDNKIAEEGRLLEHASVDIGNLNPSTLTVPLTFILTPKEVRADTVVRIEIDGERFLTERSGTQFYTTIYQDIFNVAEPQIIIEEGGATKTTADDRLGLGKLVEHSLPQIYPRFEGQTNIANGTFKAGGNIPLGQIGAPQLDILWFTELRLFITVDGEVVVEKELSAGGRSYTYMVEESFPLDKDWQSVIMVVAAADNAGLVHHYLAGFWFSSSGPVPEPYSRAGVRTIYSADGELLWKPDYMREAWW